MNPDSPKNQQLLKQYPFLAQILSPSMGLAPFDGAYGIPVHDLTIKVEKADGDLMYRQADNVGISDDSYFTITTGADNGLIMRRGEHTFAIGHGGEIVNRMNWVSSAGQHYTDECYTWNIFWSKKEFGPRGHALHTKPIFDKIKHIVWVTIEAYHTDTHIHDGRGARFGKFQKRVVHITIYDAPSQGFSRLQEESNIFQNLWLNSRIMTQGIVRHDHDLISIGGMLQEMCVTFQDMVYFNGMKAVLDQGKFRGASGQFGPVKVLCAEMCGYDRVMLEDPSCYITFQLRPEAKQMYVLGQQGRLPQIRNLVRTVVRMWNENPELREQFKPNENVSVM